MINWNEVTVGETEVVDKYGTRRLILAVHGNMIGTKIENGDYVTQFGWWKKDDIVNWTIHDPWEEITDHQWVQVENTGGSRWKLMRGDLPIYVDGVHYKSDGRRVWEWKEGRDE